MGMGVRATSWNTWGTNGQGWSTDTIMLEKRIKKYLVAVLASDSLEVLLEGLLEHGEQLLEGGLYRLQVQPTVVLESGGPALYNVARYSTNHHHQPTSIFFILRARTRAAAATSLSLTWRGSYRYLVPTVSSNATTTTHLHIEPVLHQTELEDVPGQDTHTRL